MIAVPASTTKGLFVKRFLGAVSQVAKKEARQKNPGLKVGCNFSRDGFQRMRPLRFTEVLAVR